MMATDHQQWLERGEIYAIGALDGEELNDFELHLASGCPLCAACVRDTRESVKLLHDSLPGEEPPRHLKRRILDQIAPAQAHGTRPGRTFTFRWDWLSIGIGALAAAVVMIVLASNLKRTQSQLQEVRAQLDLARAQSEAKDEQLRLLSSPHIRLVELKGLEAAPRAQARVFWNPTARGGLLIATGLPQPPPDHAYELWGIAGDLPVPMGVFFVDANGQATFQMAPLTADKSFSRFAVTVEPTPGVAKPTGPMVLLGSV
ncbi:MAG TPA: anti-sigma factor [Candidatus Binatia bacterium]|jgi:anti-sigma-K factor RskA